MASVSFNPFDVLEFGEDPEETPIVNSEESQTVAPSQSKKRRNKKKNKKAEGSQTESGDASAKREVETGSAADAPIESNANSDLPSKVLPPNASLEPIGSRASKIDSKESQIRSDSKVVTSNSSSTTTEVSASLVFEAKLEEDARKTLSNDSLKLKLWHDWMLHIQTPHPGDAALHPSSWKQVFIRSRALEITLEGCLHPPLNPLHWPHFQALLCSIVPSTETAQIFCQVAQDLSIGLSSISPDSKLLTAAKNAMTSVLSALKLGKSPVVVRLLLSRLSDSSIQQQLHQYLLQMLETERALQQTGTESSSNSSLAEKLRFSEELLNLSSQRLKLLVPENPFTLPNASQYVIPKTDSDSGQDGRSSSDSTTDSQISEIHKNALTSIRTLAKLISQKTNELPIHAEKQIAQVVKQIQPSNQSVPNNFPEIEERKNTLTELISQIDEEASSLSSQLIAAEDEVLRLKSAISDLERRRTAIEYQLQTLPPSEKLHQQTKVSRLSVLSEDSTHASHSLSQTEHANSDSKDDTISTSLQLWKSQQLGVVYGLEALLLHPSPFAGQTSSDYFNESNQVSTILGKAVSDHLQALQNHLINKQKMLHEAGQRMHFCETKLSPLKSEQKSLLAAGRQKLAMELSKPLEALEKMYKIRKEEVQAVMTDADSIEASLQNSILRTALALLPPLPPIHILLRNIGITLHQIKLDHKSILAGNVIKPTEEPSPTPKVINSRKTEDSKTAKISPPNKHTESARQNVSAVNSLPPNPILTNQAPKNAWRTINIVPSTEFESLGFQVERNHSQF